MQDTTPDTKQYQCRHIFTDGHRCGSPCLRGEDLCYYHHTTRKPVADPQQRRVRRSAFELPSPTPPPETPSPIPTSVGAAAPPSPFRCPKPVPPSSIPSEKSSAASPPTRP